jgi:hypothetical protein
MNFGIHTGRVANAPLSVVGVDLDSVDALRWALRNLPESPLRTKTSKGEHWLYRAPSVAVGNRAKLRVDGKRIDIDIRGDGGNLVCAPSVHPSGFVYQQLGQWNEHGLSQLVTFDPSWFPATEPPPAAPSATASAHQAAACRASSHNYRRGEGLLTGDGPQGRGLRAWQRPGQQGLYGRAHPPERLRPLRGRDVQPPRHALQSALPAALRRSLAPPEGPRGSHPRPKYNATLCRLILWPIVSLQSRASDEADNHSQTSRLLTLFDDLQGEAFRSHDDKPLVCYTDRGRRKTVPLTQAMRFLCLAYYRMTGQAVSSRSKDAVQNLLAAMADDGPKRQTWIRIAEHEGDLYLDLGNEDWSVIRITPNGWSLLDESPVHFLRPSSQLPLPMPERGELIDELFNFVNLPDRKSQASGACLACQYVSTKPTAATVDDCRQVWQRKEHYR